MTACFGEDPELWFIGTKDAIEKAKAICGRCPIQQACGDHALEHGIEFGIWGGKTEDERKALLEGHPLPPPEAEKVRPVPGRGKVSDVKGVTWNRWRSRWQVVICTRDKRRYGGTHTDKERAEAKALTLHQELGTSPVRRKVMA
jgi:WhiB family redox-sensing transcriptional regulator